MVADGAHEMQSVEALCQQLVELEQCSCIVPFEKGVHECKAVFVVQDVEVPDHILAAYLVAAESHRLVENRERIPHRPVRLSRYQVQGLFVYIYIFLCCYTLEIQNHILYGYAVEIVGLAT